MNPDNLTYMFIVGGQRCGTTLLSTLLQKNNSFIFTNPIHPEPKYFMSSQKRDIRAYFNDCFKKQYDHQKILVEKSTSYSETPLALKRINALNVNKKIVFLVRNPVERALSNYFFSKKNKLENRTLEQVFIKKHPKPLLTREISVDPFNYIERSKFSNQIMMLESIFSINELFITSLEYLIDKTEMTFDKLYAWIGLDTKAQMLELNEVGSVNKASRVDYVSQEIYSVLENELKNEIVFLKNRNLI